MMCDVSFCYVIFWECNLGNHNQITWLNNRRNRNFMNIHIILANQSLLNGSRLVMWSLLHGTDQLREMLSTDQSLRDRRSRGLQNKNGQC